LHEFKSSKPRAIPAKLFTADRRSRFRPLSPTSEAYANKENSPYVPWNLVVGLADHDVGV